MSYLAKREMIMRQLEMLEAGKMRTGRAEVTGTVDDTAETIDQLTKARLDYEGAIELLTKQPLIGTEAKEVHWYDLRRLTPKFSPPEKDDWSVPGETSPEAALAYFEKHEGLGEGLEICEEGDLAAEFILEKRKLLRRQVSLSQQLSRGVPVQEFYVRRR